MPDQGKTAESGSCCGPTCSNPNPRNPSREPFGEFELRPAGEVDREAVSTLLSASKLAALDDASQFGPQYAVAYDTTGHLIGVAGVELYGTNALLRSVAVTSSARFQGLGRQLTQDRLRWAANHGVFAVFLLTTDASSYWTRHGFSEISREEAPALIRSTTQWSGGCSASAVAMKRQVANAR